MARAGGRLAPHVERSATLAEKSATLAEKSATLAEKSATLAEKSATLAEKSATLARRGNDAFQPEIDGHIPILFVRVGDHSGEHAEFGALALARRDHFGGLGVGERIEGFIAHVEGLLERRDQVGFRCLRARVDRLLLAIH